MAFELAASLRAALLAGVCFASPLTFAADPAGGVADPAPVHSELKDVYEEFGGEAGMTALMDVFMDELLADPRMRPFFEASDQKRVKRQLAEQFCAILGGGCIYSGRDMKTSHEQLGATRADFNALVEDLQVAMNKQGIPFRAQNKLIAQLAPMHREIITR
ncbi:MAG: group I truncated hemoglobin [Pseudomarimonas sp.]